MDDLLSEKEQMDQMRAWWSDYGLYVIGGLVIGIGLIVGVNYYRGAKLEQQQNASAAYETLVEQIASGDADAAEATAAEISLEYADTTYVGQSGLAMARLFMDKNRDQDAADALLAVVNGDSEDELKHVARLRLARIYLYQDKAQQVVELLDNNEVEAFAPAYGEVLGDAHAALGNTEEAQAAYQTVLLNPLSEGTIDRQLVQWKALDLPEAEPEAEAVVEDSEVTVEESE